MKAYTDEQLVTNYLNPVRSKLPKATAAPTVRTSNGVKGDEKSLEILIRRYLKPIYSFVYRYIGNEEAEDLTQEVFIKIWRNLKKFNKNKNFKPWVFQIAKNTCFDFLRKKKKTSILDLEKYFYLVDLNPLPNEISEKESLKEKIQEVIEKLPSKTRQILNLYYNRGLTFREIAETSGEPLNTIKSRHRRALAMLKSIFEI